MEPYYLPNNKILACTALRSVQCGAGVTLFGMTNARTANKFAAARVQSPPSRAAFIVYPPPGPGFGLAWDAIG